MNKTTVPVRAHNQEIRVSFLESISDDTLCFSIADPRLNPACDGVKRCMGQEGFQIGLCRARHFRPHVRTIKPSLKRHMISMDEMKRRLREKIGRTQQGCAGTIGQVCCHKNVAIGSMRSFLDDQHGDVGSSNDMIDRGAQQKVSGTIVARNTRQNEISFCFVRQFL
ncbi:hypothetical protein M527_04015 [Sphingobium indicum IP26]|nr:hypothetical protein M527_04015 [Sphingobium indicum IP26]